MSAATLLFHIDDVQINQKRQYRFRRTRFDIDLPPERLKTVIAALLLFASGLCTSFALSVLNEVIPREHALPDVVFRSIPIQEWAWPASDILVLAMVIVCGLSILLHRYRWIVMRRVFLIATVLYVLRALVMLVTWIPLSDRSMINKCVTPQSVIEIGSDRLSITTSQNDQLSSDSSISGIPWSIIGRRVWQYSISLGFSAVESDRVLCGDYIYSGHTLVYVLSTMTMRLYMPRNGLYGLLRILFPLSAILGMLFVVISRLHYTVDVLIAYWMTTLTFWCYHLLIALPRPAASRLRSADLETSMQTNPSLTTVLIMDPQRVEDDEDYEDENANECRRRNRIQNPDVLFGFLGAHLVLGYFEKNVPADFVLPRELRWPFDEPKWVNRLISGLNDKCA